MNPHRVRIYSRKKCHLCDVAKELMHQFAERYPLTIEEVDIDQDPVVFEKYRYEIPVIFEDDRKLFKFRIDAKKLERTLRRG